MLSGGESSWARPTLSLSRQTPLAKSGTRFKHRSSRIDMTDGEIIADSARAGSVACVAVSANTLRNRIVEKLATAFAAHNKQTAPGGSLFVFSETFEPA